VDEKVTNNCTSDLLRSIKLMIRLESYTPSQIIEIVQAMKLKLQEKDLKPEIVIGVMTILEEISLFTREV
jgi:hypothetical protein